MNASPLFFSFPFLLALIFPIINVVKQYQIKTTATAKMQTSQELSSKNKHFDMSESLKRTPDRYKKV